MMALENRRMDDLRNRGRAHVAHDELDQATTCFAELAELNERDLEAFARLGEVHFALALRQKQPDSLDSHLAAAERALRRALDIDARRAALYESQYWLARILMRTGGDRDEVLALLDRQAELTGHDGAMQLARSLRSS
jgi:hypothetical protein